ncbi:cupin-like domain-containing protein [Pseudomarimonas salicorniae]|uniref:Cupin-like domain-containing protein n=1 Tax=Pseudomarimonas salicorniae TaxID=2933270 RepID=A0ABT0GI30_9GAMM|nr:cupin-like domain-containing protein [Lysobacter sp. CAU 1642]MCK7594002.1 cupin-like domain-containing protein [Lysobacter sp. CAU 1642]
MNIDRVGPISVAEFHAEFVVPRKPVVLTRAIEDWPALSTWSPEWFRETWGTRKVRCRGAKGETTLAEYIDGLAGSTMESPSPYLRNLNIQTDWPELAPAISPRCAYTQDDWLSSRVLPAGWPRAAKHLNQLFISGTGTYIPLHFDDWMMHAFISNVHGDKRFVLYPPGQADLLYPRDDYYLVSRFPNPFEVDLGEFPRFAEATPLSIDLHKGESVFIPCGWWHTTRTLSPCISVSSNFVCESNWNDFADELCHMRDRLGGRTWKTPLIRGYLALAGQALRSGRRLRLH